MVLFYRPGGPAKGLQGSRPTTRLLPQHPHCEPLLGVQGYMTQSVQVEQVPKVGSGKASVFNHDRHIQTQRDLNFISPRLWPAEPPYPPIARSLVNEPLAPKSLLLVTESLASTSTGSAGWAGFLEEDHRVPSLCDSSPIDDRWLLEGDGLFREFLQENHERLTWCLFKIKKK